MDAQRLGDTRTYQRGERVRLLAGYGLVAFLCVAVAAAVTGAIRPPAPFRVPPELVAAGLVFAVSVPFLLLRWRTTFWLFLAWFMVEDLIRKSLGNDIRVYFLKDVLFLLLVAGMVFDPSFRGSWTRATRDARFWLYAVIAWSMVLAVPMVFVDWRIPAIALKLDWEYVPLVVAGFVVASESGGVRKLLSGFVAIGIPACIVGIIQAYVGPGFLSPGVATPFLKLDLVRAYNVFQPSGTFVDPSRFGSMALIVLTSGLGLLVLAERDRRIGTRALGVGGVAIGGAALWANAGKANMLIAAVIVIAAICAPPFAERRLALMRAALTVAVVAAALWAMFAIYPQLSNDRAQYFFSTLAPSSAGNEWTGRIAAWTGDTGIGLRAGGPLGAGTGATSNGLQYLTGSTDFQSVTGVPQVESGYAVVALQWGVVGLVLWLAWTFVWVRRGWMKVRTSRGSPAAAVGLVLLTWVIVYLFVDLVPNFTGFQNYYANAYLWIFSGILFALPNALDLGAAGQRSRSHATATSP